MNAPGTANRATRLPSKYSPLVVGWGPSGAGDRRGNVGQAVADLDRHWEISFASVEAADRRGGWPSQGLPGRASPSMSPQ